MTGARPGQMTPLRRLLARLAARHLSAFVIPDVEIARNTGVDVAGINGLDVVATPRHANILVLAGPIPPGLARASAVAYAQIPRPRWILAVDTTHIDGLPAPDVVVDPDQTSLNDGIATLRQMIADGAFNTDVASFALEAVRTRTVFVCPMHPQIVAATPGSCPICGMDLVPQEISEEDIPEDLLPMDDDREPSGQMEMADLQADHSQHMMTRTNDSSEMAVEQQLPGPTDGSMAEHAGHAARVPADNGGERSMARTADDHALHLPTGMPDDTTKRHEQGAQMDRSATGDGAEHAGHQMSDAGAMAEHAGHVMGDDGAMMDHSSHVGGGFMSMIEITKDLPRSRDGLPMDWIDVPFGPLFPGLPGGLSLKLTLDGDTVVASDIRQGALNRMLESTWPGPVETLHERMAMLDCLAPHAYAALAWEAMASAGGAAPGEAGQRARVGVLERARALSHLAWLSAFGRLLGYRWLEQQAAALQLSLLRTIDVSDLAPIRDGVRRLVQRIERTPMLQQRLGGIGVIPPDGYGDWLTGPVARAAGRETDARVADPAYRSLGFAPVTRHASDALARLEVRLHEIVQSLDLLENAGVWTLPTPSVSPDAREAKAALEMPRGEASIHVAINQHEVSAVHVTVPSSVHVDMLPVVAESIEFADALVATASLDISPWEIDR